MLLLPLLSGQKQNLPFESLFWHSQNPCPSYTSILIDFLLLFVKTNRYPQNGSEHKTFLHTAASPSIPFLKSTAWLASSMCICGVIAIIFYYWQNDLIRVVISASALRQILILHPFLFSISTVISSGISGGLYLSSIKEAGFCLFDSFGFEGP